MNLIQQLKEKIDRAQLWHQDLLLERNEYLTKRGLVDTNLYYIVEGSVRIYFEDEFEEQVIRLGYRGNFINALDSYITGQPTDFYIQAIKKCSVRVIRKVDLIEYMETDRESLLMWQKLMELLVYQQLEREKDVLTFSPRKRYERVLARSPQLFQETPNKHIASYLRMSPETLSRIKKS